MCGRYTLGNVDTINSRFNLDIEEVYEVFPSNQILVKADSIFMVSWSFSPFWAKESIKLINARYETLKDKPSFKNTKRCGIFTNGWFEWKNIGGKKKPFYHFTNGGLSIGGGSSFRFSTVNESMDTTLTAFPEILKLSSILA